MHHLMGISEIADLLGVSRQRAHQLTQRSGFPAPAARLSSGPVWESAEVDTWAKQNPRPGRRTLVSED